MGFKSLAIPGLVLGGALLAAEPTLAANPSLGSPFVNEYNRALCEGIGSLHQALVDSVAARMQGEGTLTSFSAQGHPLNWASALNRPSCYGTAGDPQAVADRLKKVGADVMVDRMEARADLAESRFNWPVLAQEYREMEVVARSIGGIPLHLPERSAARENTEQLRVLEGWYRLKDCPDAAAQCWAQKLTWIQKESDRLAKSTDQDSVAAFLLLQRMFLDLGAPPSEISQSGGAVSDGKTAEGEVSFAPVLVAESVRRMEGVDPVPTPQIGLGVGSRLGSLERMFWVETMERFHVSMSAAAAQRNGFDAAAEFKSALDATVASFRAMELSPRVQSRLNTQLVGDVMRADSYNAAIRVYISSVVSHLTYDLENPGGTMDPTLLLGQEKICAVRDYLPRSRPVFADFSSLCQGLTAHLHHFDHLTEATDPYNPWVDRQFMECTYQGGGQAKDGLSCAGVIYGTDTWGKAEDPRWSFFRALSDAAVQ